MKSYLFVPGNQASMHVSAFAYNVDALIFDLEDSVALAHKDSARTLVTKTLETLTMFDCKKIVRINPMDSIYFHDDLHAMMQCHHVDALMIPKANVDVIRELEIMLSELEQKYQRSIMNLYVIVESAIGVETLWPMLEATSRIKGILLGGEDLATDLHVQPTLQRSELLYPRAKVAMAARAKKIVSLDTPYVDINNHQGLHQDALDAKGFGFNSKVAIHPSQVDIINNVFVPTAQEIEEARQIVDAYQNAQKQGLGVFSHKGKMVDKPILDRAQAVLNESQGK